MMLNLPVLHVRLVISALGVSVVCDSTGTKHSYESLCGVFPGMYYFLYIYIVVKVYQHLYCIIRGLV